jgi:ClpP class serine protease
METQTMTKRRNKNTRPASLPAASAVADTGPDNIPALMDTPFAIHGDGFSQIQTAVDDLGTVQAIMARPGIRMDKTEYVTIRGTVAVVEIIGPIFHYDNILAWIYGFPAAEQLIMEIQAAENNPAVKSIVLHIDSPGGQVGGIAELATHIRHKITKPVVAYVGDMGASAAYWIAAAADMIVANETAELGSIGVVITMRRSGDNQIEIVSSVSPNKRPDPATDEGRATFQARADALAEVFVTSIMTYRGLSRDQVTGIGGDVVIAAKAVEIGLADETGSLEGVVSALQNGGITMPARKPIKKGEVVMTPEELKASHPDTYDKVFAWGKQQGKADAADETAGAVAAAETAAKDMVLGLMAVVLGEDAKTKLDNVLAAGLTAEQVKVSMDLFGKPVPGFAASGDSQPPSGAPSRQQILDGITGAVPPPAPPAADGSSTPDPADAFVAKVDAHQAANNCKRSVSIETVAAGNPELYQGWLKAQQKK